jgi:hypothetical protein
MGLRALSIQTPKELIKQKGSEDRTEYSIPLEQSTPTRRSKSCAQPLVRTNPNFKYLLAHYQHVDMIKKYRQQDFSDQYKPFVPNRTILIPQWMPHPTCSVAQRIANIFFSKHSHLRKVLEWMFQHLMRNP